jgi:hypothetical protein
MVLFCILSFYQLDILPKYKRATQPQLNSTTTAKYIKNFSKPSSTPQLLFAAFVQPTMH